MTSFAIGELIVILVILIGLFYVWKEEKKKGGSGYGDALYLGAIFIVLELMFGGGGVLFFLGLFFLLIGLFGKLVGKKE
jgi:hypothetical protein